MFRATTPTHIFCFGEINPSDFKTILITYAQNDRIVLEKNKEDLTIWTEEVNGETHYHASLKLSQEETKRFLAKPSSSVSIQIRALDYNDDVIASNKMTISVQDVLNDEVLE